MRRLLVRPVFLTVLALAATIPSATAQTYDILIRNARVLDGTGNDWFRADIAITGDRIERIGRLPDATAHRTIDATGLYVSPGFIDLHSHADRAMMSLDLEARRAKSLNSQGTDDGHRGPGRTQREVADHPGDRRAARNRAMR